MSEEQHAHQAPYHLRAQTSGMGALDPRTALLLWGVGSILLGLTISFLLIRGEIRLIVLILLAMLGLVCLSPRRGVFVLTVFLPFMYGLRRIVLNFQPFEQRDPILLFPAITAAAMFMGVAIFYGPVVFHYLKRSALLKACVLLMGVFLIEMINPLQGGILIGVAGAMYFIIPMLWCFFGLLLEREDLHKVFRIVLVIGFITALYGLKQHYFGMTQVEIYELKAKQFYKTFGGEGGARAMSTFSSPGDFSQYLMIASYLSFAYFWRSRKNLSLILLLAVNVWSMIWEAVRTSFLLLAFGVLAMLALTGRSVTQIVIRTFAAFLAVAIAYGILYQYDPQRMYTAQFSDNPFVVHTLSGITHPTEEKSFKQRLQNWAFITTSALTEYPGGRGLGSTTTAAAKFSGGQPFTADSYFFELFYGSGIIAPVLFAVIVVSIVRSVLRRCLQEPEVPEYKVCFGLIAAMLLGSFFGLAPRDFISGPLMWLVIGWTVRQDLDRTEPGDEPALEPAGPSR